MHFSSPDPSQDEHTHDQSSVPKHEWAAAGRQSTWVSVAVNLFLSAVQIVVGHVSHSQALMADGLHSLSDLFSDFVVLIAGRQAHKAADADHPYGHQRFETGASLALGFLLMAVGVGMLWSAFHKLQSPADVPPVHGIALGVACLTLVSKEMLFRYMLAVAKRVKSSLLVANAWHARSDAASSLVVGLGVLGNLAGYPILDPIAASIVGFMVGRMGWEFGWNALHDLMDRAAEADEVEAIRQTLVETPGVINVHEVRTRKMGDMIIVDAHIEVDGSITVEAGHDIAHAAADNVMRHHRVLSVMTHVDPWRRTDRSSTMPVTPSTRGV